MTGVALICGGYLLVVLAICAVLIFGTDRQDVW